MTFVVVVVVFNPTTGVVTFHLRGWCMLGVFFLLAFTRLGHECQDAFFVLFCFLLLFFLVRAMVMHVCTSG